MGDVGLTARQRRVRVAGSRLAHLLLVPAAAMVAAGLFLLAGLAWALLVVGVLLAVYALLLVDVGAAAPAARSAVRPAEPTRLVGR